VAALCGEDSRISLWTVGLALRRNASQQRRELARRIGVVFGQRSQLWWDLPLIDSFERLRAIYQVSAASHAERLAECAELLGLDAFLATEGFASSLSGSACAVRSPQRCCTVRNSSCSMSRRSAWTWNPSSG
jgi:hypothetical protein